MSAERLPSLSVVMPNYNHARYLPVSLDAVCRQSVAPREFIIVDDCSTDASVSIIEGFAARYPFVKLVRHERNRGAMDAVRTGLAAASSEALFFTSADDLTLPGLFEKSLGMLARHPRAGLCSALARMLSLDGKDIGPYETSVISPVPCYLPPEKYLQTYKEHGNWISPYTVMYRLSAVRALGGPDPELGPPADGVLNREIAMTYGVCFMPEHLAMWRRPVTGGVGQEYAKDFRNVLELGDRIVRKLKNPKGRAPTPDELEYARLWRQRDVVENIGYRLEEAMDYAKVAALLERMPDPGLLDRLMLAFVRACPRPWRLPVKLYHFWRQRPAEKRRLLRRRLGLMLGRGTRPT